MNYSTFAALTNYDTVAAALAANPVDGSAWLLNETKIFQDGTMPKSGPPAVKKSRQIQMAKTLNPTIRRNKVVSSREGYQKSSLTDAAHKNVVSNTKSPFIRHKVSWYVTDSSQSTGYRRVFGILEDPTTTSPYRDDDAQIRK